MTLLGFVGDVLVDREQPESAFEAVADVLAVPDILFGNCEAPYSTAPHLAPTSGIPLTPRPENTAAFHFFDVLSLANNHIVDGGHAAMLETADHLRRVGAIPVGVGRDIVEARKPAVIERGGLRVAYLAYASVFPYGYEARVAWPGLAPVRAMNHHIERLPNYWVPGMLGTVVSVPHENDYRALAEDLEHAGRSSDCVVASFHWGDFQQPYTLTDHERRTAHFAIDHGADIVVGHHHHILRGVEWYRDRPIFYGLGHFVLDLRDPPWPDWYEAARVQLGEADSYELYDRPGWPLLPMHPDARLTMLGWVDLDDAARPIAAGFLPCTLAPDGRVQAHDARSPEGEKVRAYVERCCQTEHLPVTLSEAVEHSIGGLASIRFDQEEQ
jgi:poly-gamma-glutamate capsule biosynthesis protein CapA/YwtB (metallophosphatase superfamily)